MTIAVDIRTGAVVGQVVSETPDLVLAKVSYYTILTKKGYQRVWPNTVRLEKIG